MTITLDTSDPRCVKAIELAAQAGQWARCHTADGTKMYGIPASGDPLHLYLTTLTSCSCEDFKRRGLPCKHMLAVKLHCALAKAVKTSPARLVATREDEDVVSWALAGRG